MKLTSYLSASTIALFIVFGGCGKDDPNKDNADVKFIFCDFNSYLIGKGKGYEHYNSIGISDVQVDFYANEADYFANKNITKTLYSDSKGEINFRVEKTKKDIFFRASKNNLNSIRTGLFTNNVEILKKYNGDKYNSSQYFFSDIAELSQQYSGNIGICSIIIALSETPTKLNVEVFKSGNPQVGKKVILTDELGNVMNGELTNSSGTASFNFLIPQKYFFYIDKASNFQSWGQNQKYINLNQKIDTTLAFKTNPVSTNGKLADNPDITNMIQVSY